MLLNPICKFEQIQIEFKQHKFTSLHYISGSFNKIWLTNKLIHFHRMNIEATKNCHLLSRVWLTTNSSDLSGSFKWDFVLICTWVKFSSFMFDRSSNTVLIERFIIQKSWGDYTRPNFLKMHSVNSMMHSNILSFQKL